MMFDFFGIYYIAEILVLEYVSFIMALAINNSQVYCKVSAISIIRFTLYYIVLRCIVLYF